MAFTHTHILTCHPCNNPLLLPGPNPITTLHAVLTYHLTTAAILTNKSTNIPSQLLLLPTAEDGTNNHPSLHVLHMEGFDSAATRRAFAAHCGLDAAVLEVHFARIARLAGTDMGRCWCACHDLSSGGTVVDLSGDDGHGLWPESPAPVGGRATECLLGGVGTMKKRKRRSVGDTRGARLKRLNRVGSEDEVET